MMWTLEEALAFIRYLEPECKRCGYFIALAGGVLYNGSSDNDLDILMVPRIGAFADRAKLIELLNREFNQVSAPLLGPLGWTIFRLSVGKQPVDVTLFPGPSYPT